MGQEPKFCPSFIVYVQCVLTYCASTVFKAELLYCNFRTATARGKAEQADVAAVHAREDGQMAVKCAHQYQNQIESATPAPNPNQQRPEPFFKGNLHDVRVRDEPV